MADCPHGVEIAAGVVCRSCHPALTGLRLVGDDTHSGLRILPGELIKAEPFNAMARKIEVLEVVIQELAKRMGMTDEDVAKLFESVCLRIATAEKLMED